MFERIRQIRGRRYRYRELRWRAEGKVKSRSIYLGPAEGGALDVNGAPTSLGHGGYVEQMMQYPAEKAASDDAEAVTVAGRDA